MAEFVEDAIRELNIARELRHTPEHGDGSGGWVMHVRYLVTALAAARAAFPHAEAPPTPARTAENAELRAQLNGYQEREAACCPEDVGFEEVIHQLRAMNANNIEQLVKCDTAQVERSEALRVLAADLRAIAREPNLVVFPSQRALDVADKLDALATERPS